MDDPYQPPPLLRWRRELEEQRQYQVLRRRRYLQMERQHQRQRLVMAAMEPHERRRKRYQRALEQRRGVDQQQFRRIEHDRKYQQHQVDQATTTIAAVQDILAVDMNNGQDIHDSVAKKITKLAVLETLKHQLDNCMQHLQGFLASQKPQQQRHSDTPLDKFATTGWTLVSRLVIVLVYEDTLMRLLLQLDGVTSDGDDMIRQQRKILVKRVNGWLDQLDQYKQ